MKVLRIFTLTMLLSLTFCACDKPFSGDEDTETTAKTDEDDDNSSGYDNEEDSDDDGSGTQVDDTLNVTSFISTSYDAQIWLKGYIVGCATGAGGKRRYETSAPFSYDTALLIADDPNETDTGKMASICLTSKKKLREIANLKDNPQNKGKRIAVFGYQDTYLKLYGIKAIDAYEFPSK